MIIIFNILIINKNRKILIDFTLTNMLNREVQIIHNIILKQK
jgi:hypothetical protein